MKEIYLLVCNFYCTGHGGISPSSTEMSDLSSINVSPAYVDGEFVFHSRNNSGICLQYMSITQVYAYSTYIRMCITWVYAYILYVHMCITCSVYACKCAILSIDVHITNLV